MYALAWLAGVALGAQFGDALLAVGGEDCAVTILSVARCAAVAVLAGHNKRITQLAACAERPENVLSLAEGEGAMIASVAQTGFRVRV